MKQCLWQKVNGKKQAETGREKEDIRGSKSLRRCEEMCETRIKGLA